ncbi:hypothetical protein F5Y14DRAFT_462755 [Nemania sp. NC0429]|nr:hypothetical protein F5Y14DRAFT_462755 [Nemania sp. NC0429]
MSPSQPTIVYIIGATATGKGTLGKRLATHFGFYHISLGEKRRSYGNAIRAELPSMSEAVRRCIQGGTAIPEDILQQYDPVPATLRYHNLLVGNHKRWSAELASMIIDEELAKARALEAERGGEYTGIIIDGHPVTEGQISHRVIEAYKQAFSGLSIVIESPREVAQQRYLSRARLVIEDSTRFESRMKTTDKVLPGFIESMKGYGEVVFSTNDGTMTIDDAYHALLGELDKNSKVWHTLKERSWTVARVGPGK